MKQKQRMTLKLLGATVLLWLMTGCASMVPETLQLQDKETPLVSYTEVQAQAEARQGSYVRWGGLLIDIQNGKTQTELEVIAFQLNSKGAPQIKKSGDLGRFKIVVDGFVDPEIYKVGERITVLGKYLEIQHEAVGEYEYPYPVIQSQGLHLWPVAESNTTAHYSIGYGYGYGYPVYYGMSHPYYFRHRGVWGEHPTEREVQKEQKPPVMARPLPKHSEHKVIEP